MKLENEINLSEVIKYEHDPKTQKGNFIVASASGMTVKDVDELLSHYGTATGNDIKSEHGAMGAAIVEPILNAVPYKRWTNLLLTPIHFDPSDDWRIPVEDYVSTAYQTGPDSEVMFVRPGTGWTRPSLQQYSSGVEMPWSVMEYSGWNQLGRLMDRASDEIARLIDNQMQAVIDTAVDGLPGQGSVVSGGVMTKAAVDAVIKAAAASGFPLQTAVINSGTLTDMSAWSGGPFYNAGLPTEVAKSILQTLSWGPYGGVNWYSSPFVPTNFVYFAGPPASTGYEIHRGEARTASDVDIRKRIDLHEIISDQIGGYVGNSLNVRRLRIAA